MGRKRHIKRRRLPYGDAIKTVYHKFIHPFIKKIVMTEQEEKRALFEGIHRFFNVDTRSIYFAKAKETFTIPGKEWLNGHPKTLGYSGAPRKVKRGLGMVIRFDDLDLDLVELEFDERIYSMDSDQWDTIKDLVEFIA